MTSYDTSDIYDEAVQSSNRTNILMEMVCTNRTNLHAGKYLITKNGIPNENDCVQVAHKIISYNRQLNTM